MGELGRIPSAAGMNFSGEYFICVTGTRLSHRADPLTAPTCKDKRRKKKKRQSENPLSCTRKSPASFCVIISDFSDDAGTWGGGARSTLEWLKW